MEQKPKQNKAVAMDLKELKTYRPVQFNKQLESFFHPANPKFKGLTMQFDATMQVVRIDLPGKDSVMIVPANIEYMK